MPEPEVSISAPTIIMSSTLKSGTWLLRAILDKLTGLEYYEPEIFPGRPVYDDPAVLTIPEGHYFSWHLAPANGVATAMRERNAKVVFLVRNIYDIMVSMDFHLSADVDADIGRSAGQSEFLSRFSDHDRRTLVINGYCEPPFDWHGLGPVFFQMQEMLTYAESNLVFITSYERLSSNKNSEVNRLARYLGVPLTPKKMESILKKTGFSQMRSDAERNGRGAKHYRRGIIGGHHDELSEFHKTLIHGLMHNTAPMLVALARKIGFHEIIKSRR